VTLKSTLWPTANVYGNVNPLVLNPEPVTFAPEIVTLPPPELPRISVSVWELPTWTLLKLRLVGLAPSWPELTAVPDIVTVTALDVLAA
jgi:hypothetical protein